jgi:hypothetical protein
MDPISGTLVLGTVCVAGTLVGYAGIESYNRLSEIPVVDGQMTPISEIDLTRRD